jgi:hypothetical protein
MIPLPEYAKIKDKYCIAYNGYSKEYIVQLRLLRPIMEKTFPGIMVYLSCRDEHMYLLKNEERIISRNSLKENKNNFAYIREIYCNLIQHPIESFMNESDIKINTNLNKIVGIPSSCVLLTTCVPPVKPLTSTQINKIIDYLSKKGLKPAINQPIDEFDLVVGVECDQLYEAGAKNKDLILIPTGFGENLFKSMFPWAQIIKIDA